MDNLKISINAKRFEKAFGGGNHAANTLEDYLKSKGHLVYRTLKPNLDVILIFSSKCSFKITSYNYNDISDYIAAYPNTVVIHRVNSCDEARGANLEINSSMIKYNKLADFTIYISQFIQDVFESKGMASQQRQIILNGADTSIFYPERTRKDINNVEKIKIVTHHWSSNFMKGFDIYERLDQLLDTSPFQNMFEFTYIGNTPVGVNFKNTSVIKPLPKNEIAAELRKHHIYLTAARNEAAGMHHIEGMLCGLPVLFLNSGALPEYCKPYGIEFSLINFEDRLIEIKNHYYELYNKVMDCSYSSDLMVSKYERIILEQANNRRSRPKKRNIRKLLERKLKKPFRKSYLLLTKILNYYRNIG